MRGLFGAVLLLVSSVAAAQDYNYLDHKMLNTEANPFEYHLDARAGATPSHLSVAAVETVLKGAVQKWDDVACASTAFEYRGQVDDPEVPSVTDGRSVALIWVHDPLDPAYDQALGGGAHSAAAVWRTYGGVLSTCDIFINAVDRRWSISASVPADHLDLETALLHELGHCQGLDHTNYNPESVMNPWLPVGSFKRVLDPHDVGQLCAWSPREGAVGSPCTLGQTCGSPELTCVPAQTPFGQPFCSRPCGPGTDPSTCPDPYVCHASTSIDGADAICVPPEGLVVDVGAPCDDPAQCGAAAGLCIFEDSQDPFPSGATAWQDGYCTQACGVGSAPCPFGSVCEELGAGNSRCLESCTLGFSECRDGYVCLAREGDRGVCKPRCGADVDCEGDATCRTCDGTCVERGAPGAVIGDACTEDAQCGTGQHCLKRPDATGVCTQRCDSACTSCPSGTTCFNVGTDRLCLRNCEAESQCDEALQCAPLESGSACYPACEGDGACPVGNVCVDGQCTDPNAADGGCGALCGPDAGTPQPPVTPPTPIPQGGCGCQGGAAGVSALGLLGALFLLAGRRRSHGA